MKDWQSISSVDDLPKDGSWIALTSTWNKYARSCAQWLEGQGWINDQDRSVDMTTYTHWQPFPEPPSA